MGAKETPDWERSLQSSSLPAGHQQQPQQQEPKDSEQHERKPQQQQGGSPHGSGSSGSNESPTLHSHPLSQGTPRRWPEKPPLPSLVMLRGLASAAAAAGVSPRAPRGSHSNTAANSNSNAATAANGNVGGSGLGGGAGLPSSVLPGIVALSGEYFAVSPPSSSTDRHSSSVAAAIAAFEETVTTINNDEDSSGWENESATNTADVPQGHQWSGSDRGDDDTTTAAAAAPIVTSAAVAVDRERGGGRGWGSAAGVAHQHEDPLGDVRARMVNQNYRGSGEKTTGYTGALPPPPHRPPQPPPPPPQQHPHQRQQGDHEEHSECEEALATNPLSILSILGGAESHDDDGGGSDSEWHRRLTRTQSRGGSDADDADDERDYSYGGGLHGRGTSDAFGSAPGSVASRSPLGPPLGSLHRFSTSPSNSGSASGHQSYRRGSATAAADASSNPLGSNVVLVDAGGGGGSGGGVDSSPFGDVARRSLASLSASGGDDGAGGPPTPFRGLVRVSGDGGGGGGGVSDGRGSRRHSGEPIPVATLSVSNLRAVSSRSTAGDARTLTSSSGRGNPLADSTLDAADYYYGAPATARTTTSSAFAPSVYTTGSEWQNVPMPAVSTAARTGARAASYSVPGSSQVSPGASLTAPITTAAVPAHAPAAATATAAAAAASASHADPAEAAQQQLRQCADADGCLTVVDPQRRKLRVPVSAIRPSKATSGRLKTPSLCLLHQAGRCRQGASCFQVHADPGVVERLRREAAEAPCCCALHGDANERLYDAAAHQTRSVAINGQHVIPANRLAYTAGMERILLQADRQSVCVNAGAVCDLHGREGGCRFGADCRFLHICRTILHSELASLWGGGGAHGGNSSPTPSSAAPSPHLASASASTTTGSLGNARAATVAGGGGRGRGASLGASAPDPAAASLHGFPSPAAAAAAFGAASPHSSALSGGSLYLPAGSVALVAAPCSMPGSVHSSAALAASHLNSSCSHSGSSAAASFHTVLSAHSGSSQHHHHHHRRAAANADTHNNNTNNSINGASFNSIHNSQQQQQQQQRQPWGGQNSANVTPGNSVLHGASMGASSPGSVLLHGSRISGVTAATAATSNMTGSMSGTSVSAGSVHNLGTLAGGGPPHFNGNSNNNNNSNNSGGQTVHMQPTAVPLPQYAITPLPGNSTSRSVHNSHIFPSVDEGSFSHNVNAASVLHSTMSNLNGSSVVYPGPTQDGGGGAAGQPVMMQMGASPFLTPGAPHQQQPQQQQQQRPPQWCWIAPVNSVLNNSNNTNNSNNNSAAAATAAAATNTNTTTTTTTTTNTNSSMSYAHGHSIRSFANDQSQSVQDSSLRSALTNNAQAPLQIHSFSVKSFPFASSVSHDSGALLGLSGNTGLFSSSQSVNSTSQQQQQQQLQQLQQQQQQQQGPHPFYGMTGSLPPHLSGMVVGRGNNSSNSNNNNSSVNNNSLRRAMQDPYQHPHQQQHPSQQQQQGLGLPASPALNSSQLGNSFFTALDGSVLSVLNGASVNNNSILSVNTNHHGGSSMNHASGNNNASDALAGSTFGGGGGGGGGGGSGGGGPFLPDGSGAASPSQVLTMNELHHAVAAGHFVVKCVNPDGSVTLMPIGTSNSGGGGGGGSSSN